MAVKYLGAYVSRTAIGDGRIVSVDEETVTFRWKNRDKGGVVEILTITGEEFVRRYLRHVLPRGLRSIRYYGFCHPAAKRKREQVRMHTGTMIQLGDDSCRALPSEKPYECSECSKPMRLVGKLPRRFEIKALKSSRGPPVPKLILVRGGVSACG